jgi:HAE1 family hydrophobic/amphiphilic exporter-1
VTDIETFRPRYDGLTPSSTILPIRVQGQRREAPLSSLSAINVGTAERPIPLGTVAVFERLAASGVIYHRDGQRVATLSATALAATMDPAQAIQELHNRSPLPNSMEVINFGLEAVTTSHLQALLSLLGLAMFLVLVVMAVQFEDLLQPLLILLAVPMAVAGALPGLHVLGYGLDTMSGIGLVVLSGIAVNNAIVLVTTVNLYRDRGMNVQDAIRNAAKSRLRPIAMTTLTTVLALLPLAIGWGDAAQLRAPLAIAVIAGMCSSTVCILIALPGILAMVMRSPKRSTPG